MGEVIVKRHRLGAVPRFRRRVAREILSLRQLFALPPAVAAFQWRARRKAARAHDEFALASATRPSDLGVLLSVARGAKRVVELGSGSGWTAISLALADPRRRVESYDPAERPRALYLALAPSAGARITFVCTRGDAGPRDAESVDLLYIDSSHGRVDTIREFQAWRAALRSGSAVVFDDYAHPQYPGVREAVAALDLSGEERGTLFVHRIP